MQRPEFCQQCGSRLDLVSLACSECGRLVFATELKNLSLQATAAEKAGELAEAIRCYEEMLSLLPETTQQYQSISGMLPGLRDRLSGPKPAEESQNWKKLVGALGFAGALAWKFKTVLLLLLGKGKFLLLGLTKLPTLLSMFVFAGVYWSQYGWRYAVGLVLTIYLHEMGHMWAFSRFGIPTTAPMFIPGFGAIIWSKVPIMSARQDAVIGLAGPWWGFGSALLAAGLSFATGEKWLLAIAHTAAVMNLFNLTPVWFLDGSHAHRVLGQHQRVMLLATMLGLWYLSAETMFFLVALGEAFRVFFTRKELPGVEPDNGIFYQYVALLVGLGFLALVTPAWQR
jgi:Zn-dependent protease